MSKDLTERQNILLGVCAALAESIILQPTLYFKNAKARGLPFTLNPAIVYRGTGASIINECQMMAVQFGMTSAIQKFVCANNRIFQFSSTLSECLSAMIGGMLSAFLASPVELVMIQQQIYGKSIVRTVSSIAATNGVFSKRGLMRGLLPTIFRDGIYVTGLLGVTPRLQEHLMTEHHYSASTAGFYASMVGGIAAALPSHPFDLVKTIMQGDRLMGNSDGRVKDSGARSLRTVGILTLPLLNHKPNPSTKLTKPQPKPPDPDPDPSPSLTNSNNLVKSLWREGGIRRFSAGLFWRTFNITGITHPNPVPNYST